MSKKIVVALGGNAILTNDPTANGQQKALKETAKYLVQFVQNGDKLIITHGNGPQVGNLMLQQAGSDSAKNPAMPLDTVVAMTQGSIGFWLQNALQTALSEQRLDVDVSTVLTQVEVSKDDAAFSNPTKPIGPFLTESEVKAAKANNSEYEFVEDAGRGYRRVVPSPHPINVIEADTINTLINANVIPIAAGGGGIPVVKENEALKGVEAVIDKDFASAKLAKLVNADTLIILTGVDYIYVNYNQPNQKELKNVTVHELKQYIEEGQFAKGSMLPKVEAAVEFVESGIGDAVVTSLENIGEFLKNQSGTIITR